MTAASVTALWLALALILMIIGVAGLISPALPGLPLMFVASWLIAYAGDFAIMGAGTLIVLAVLTAVGVSLDFIAGLLGAKFAGAGKAALWGAFWGGVVGIFFGIAGMIFGPLIGAIAGECLAKRNLWRAGVIGILAGTAVKAACAVAMIFIVVLAHLWALL